MTELQPIRRALVSVYDKTGLIELGQQLADNGVEIVSTGSTAAKLANAGVPGTSVVAFARPMADARSRPYFSGGNRRPRSGQLPEQKGGQPGIPASESG